MLNKERFISIEHRCMPLCYLIIFSVGLMHVLLFVKGGQQVSWKYEAYLLFPIHLDGTLLDRAKTMKAKKEFFSTIFVLQIFRQVMRTLISSAFASCVSGYKALDT